MNYILAVKFGIRTISGHRIHVAIYVGDTVVAGLLALANQSLSQSVWFGENRRFSLPIATFVKQKLLITIPNAK